MNIVVTGGSGFIGSNFLTRFVPLYPQHHFINIDKLTYAANPNSLNSLKDASNYQFLNIDIIDTSAINNVFDTYKPELVIHFAAESHVDRSISNPRVFIDTNIIGTLNLLEASRKLDKVLFHHVSTDEVYGSLGDTGLFTEDTRYDPSSPYSASKAASDHLVRSYHRTFGLPVKITNCSNNYGPRQFPEKLIPLMITNALQGKPLPVYGNGTNVRDWLYVDDHCEAIRTVILRGKIGETYNIGGNNEIKNVDIVYSLCNILANELNRPVSDFTDLITFVPDRPGHDQRYAIDASKISTHCGWKPKETFKTGLIKTVRWYLSHCHD